MKMMQRIGISVDPKRLEAPKSTPTIQVSAAFKKAQDRLSVASVRKEVLENEQRYKPAPKPKRGSHSRFSVLNNGLDEDDEDRKVRASLLPFRDLVVFAHDNTIAFAEEETQKVDTPATSSPITFPPDPFTGPSNGEAENARALPSEGCATHDEGTNKPLTGPSTSQGDHPLPNSSHLDDPQQKDSHQQLASPDTSISQGVKETKAPASTRIPRGIRPSQGERIPNPLVNLREVYSSRSAIPTAVRRHSVQSLSSHHDATSSHVASGIGSAEKPHGPRPKPESEEPQQTPTISEDAREMENVKDVSIASPPSPVSDWSFPDEERPEGVYTGEYRKPERLIMGPDSPGSNYAVTQRSNPALVHYPDAPRHSPGKGPHVRNPTNSEEDTSTKAEDKSPTDSTRATRNFCRPQISLEAIPKRGSSGRDQSILRKPVNRPSLPSLFSSSSQEENVPLVPKIPKQYEFSQPDSPVTPVRAKSQLHERSVPSTGGSSETVKSFPPRTSSKQAVHELVMSTDLTPPVMNSGIAAPELKPRSDVTFDDIVPQNVVDGNTTRGIILPRLPDSKSNRMLDSFRSIFKQKSGTDKGRGKREEGTPGCAVNVQTPVTAIRIKNDDNKGDSAKTIVKAKSRYTRLSDGVSWNKSNPKTSEEVVAAGPTLVSASPMLAPTAQNAGENTPSFARPTKSTRTKAAIGLKVQAPNSQDIRTRRTHVTAAPTGSPQRLGHGYRRSQTGPSIQKSSISRPLNIVRSSPNLKSYLTEVDASDPGAKTLSDIHSCIEILCKRTTIEGIPTKREYYLRMTLSLQQQLSDYISLKKEATEAEALAYKKRSEKSAAENILFDHFSQVRAQLDEE
ncbi:hypothetical protein FE257_010542 [Aspergillus nanangensis]|uniref:Uncharacterized protein n=1 Tax=Aspergillus nanangensis TaxID=2582783 RepID=A0AAD4CIX4_ASPNN|nr:hypothetical protein FE257_010542 [Aspergillus nanangensis]